MQRVAVRYASMWAASGEEEDGKEWDEDKPDATTGAGVMEP
jgi:hypothetical protein